MFVTQFLLKVVYVNMYTFIGLYTYLCVFVYACVFIYVYYIRTFSITFYLSLLPYFVRLYFEIEVKYLDFIFMISKKCQHNTNSIVYFKLVKFTRKVFVTCGHPITELLAVRLNE